jgi:hypothetical protein
MIKLNKVNIQEINHFIDNKLKTNMGQMGEKKPICNTLMGETPFEAVSGRISPKWTRWGKHS